MPKETIKAAFESGQEQIFEYRSTHGQRSYCISAFILPEKDKDGNIDSALSIVYGVSKEWEKSMKSC